MRNSTFKNIKKAKTIGNKRLYIYEIAPETLYSVVLCNEDDFTIEKSEVFMSWKDALESFNKMKEQLYEKNKA